LRYIIFTDKKAIVYWIHLEEHTDIFTEGYVGVSTNYRERWKTHKYYLKRNKHENSHFQNAYNLYGLKNLIFDTVLIGTEDYCYEVERKLRPEKRIGWNIEPGGNRPPITTDYKHSKETKNKISIITRNYIDLKKNFILIYIPTKTPYIIKNLKASCYELNLSVEDTVNTINNSKHYKGYKLFCYDDNSQPFVLPEVTLFEIINPDGDLIYTTDLNNYCKKNNLNESGMRKVAKGSRMHYKGYKMKTNIIPSSTYFYQDLKMSEV
jgi:hypothetical protein